MPTPPQLATDKKAAVLLAAGCEEVEALAVVDALFRAGIRADLVSVSQSLEVVSSHGVRIIADALVADVELADYDLLYLPGGMPGTLHLKACPAVPVEVLRRADAGEPIAAICAAPSILAELGVLDRRRATANPAFMEAIAQGGATAEEKPVVVDGAITTSRGAGTAFDLGLELVRQMLGDGAADAVRAGIVHSR